MQAAFSEKLPCELDGEERALKADELARQIKAHAELQESKRQATAAAGLKIKASEELISKLAVMVRTGIEYREIGCVERPDLANSVVDIVRMDDGRIVRSRPMEPHEKQAQLFDAGYQVIPINRGKSPNTVDEH